ncbi:MAG: co-chaperone GroES [Candidatus Aureabacteria bacterium]|nr:co-chaperone GroES [Candidatus Auribacterota bacterium]
MKLQPTNGRILLKPIEAKDKTPGGLYLPDTAREKLQEGEVIATAKDATDEVVVGDHVVYKEFAGTDVQIKGQDYILLTADDLLAKYITVDEIPE